MSVRSWCVLACLLLCPRLLGAQVLTQRGFVDSRATLFPERAVNDPTRFVGDVIWREELFFTPVSWLQLAGGIDARANSYDQVDEAWRLDIRDRRVQRPALSVRRLAATMTRGRLTLDIGKQFIRWGTVDIVTPTDRLAPRDFLNVVDGEFLPVAGIRGVLEFERDRIDVAVVPWMTPSRIPLATQRWTVVPPEGVPAVPGGPVVPASLTVRSVIPDGIQSGVRWRHEGAGYEYSLSVFDGFNVLPNVEVTPGTRPGELVLTRTYPALRAYGADTAVPLAWFIVKAEMAWSTSPDPASDEFVLFVVQVERQSGEWQFLGGYVGEVVTARGLSGMFSPDRGLARSLVGRASKTIDVNRRMAFETAVRANGNGAYVKGEYSQARGAHWRGTVTAAWIGGAADDFLGQYRQNSHVTVSVRFSY